MVDQNILNFDITSSETWHKRENPTRVCQHQGAVIDIINKEILTVLKMHEEYYELREGIRENDGPGW